MLTQKHYIKIAEILRNAFKKHKFYSSGEIIAVIVTDLEKTFKKDNDKFDEERFRKAIYKN